MSEILSPDAIATLVAEAKQGHLPDLPPSAGQRRGQRLRTVDFSRPTKFTSDQQRRITRATETFCQTANTRLSSELRTPIELELLNTMQLTWTAAQNQLPPNSLSVVINVDPIGTRMVMTAEQSFVLLALDFLLGGAPDRPPAARRLSEIDWSLTRRLFESIVQPLSLIWQDLAGVSLTPGEIDPVDASQAASVSEPTFTILFECRINKLSFTLGLLIPYIAVEPIAQVLSGREEAGPEDESPQASPIHRAMSTVPVTLRAEVASVDMEVQDILALAPGSVIALGARADEGVTLFAQNIKLARALPGSNGPRRAIQIRGSAGTRS